MECVVLHVTNTYPFRRAGVCMSPVVNMLFDGESVTKNLIMTG